MISINQKIFRQYEETPPSFTNSFIYTVLAIQDMFRTSSVRQGQRISSGLLVGHYPAFCTSGAVWNN